MHSSCHSTLRNAYVRTTRHHYGGSTFAHAYSAADADDGAEFGASGGLSSALWLRNAHHCAGDDQRDSAADIASCAVRNQSASRGACQVNMKISSGDIIAEFAHFLWASDFSEERV